MSQETTFNLTATYKSPQSEPFTLHTKIPSPPTASVADKTQYLSALGQAITATQAHINKELTARMEEDKARDATATAKTGAVVDEDKEEENYGEEVVEDDD